MPLPSHIHVYRDVERVLDGIVADGTACTVNAGPRQSDATAWRARASKFRVLFREGNGGISPYDELIFRAPVPGNGCWLVPVDLREGHAVTVVNAAGEAVPLPEPFDYAAVAANPPDFSVFDKPTQHRPDFNRDEDPL